ncbi:MAG: hypothetical protein ABF976_03085, partial [Acetobacter syzygii]|uniref:hypothetical protein n=1 Tax=Acetobacter syzygii TaxID=146476 RepID=UPI0024301AC2
LFLIVTKCPSSQGRENNTNHLASLRNQQPYFSGPPEAPQTLNPARVRCDHSPPQSFYVIFG